MALDPVAEQEGPSNARVAPFWGRSGFPIQVMGFESLFYLTISTDHR
jgi:hypothetical protein